MICKNEIINLVEIFLSCCEMLFKSQQSDVQLSSKGPLSINSLFYSFKALFINNLCHFRQIY
jgi:hypothetical protein